MPEEKNKKGKIKYWVSAFDRSEENKGNPRAPKFDIILRHPETKEEWRGGLFLKRSSSGTLYLSGEVRENDSELVDSDDLNLEKLYQDDVNAKNNQSNDANSDTDDSDADNSDIETPTKDPFI